MKRKSTAKRRSPERARACRGRVEGTLKRKPTKKRGSAILKFDEILEQIEKTPEITPTQTETPKKTREHKITIQPHKTPPLSPYVVRLKTERPEPPIPQFKKVIQEQETVETMAEPVPEPFKIQSRPAFKLPTVKIPSIKLPKFKAPTIKIPTIKVPTFKLPTIALPQLSLKPALRPVASFLIIALLATVPAGSLAAYTKARQTGQTIFEHGIQAAKLLSPTEFLQTRQELTEAVGILDKILPIVPKAGKTYQNAKLLLSAGAHLTQGLQITTNGLEQLSQPTTEPLTTRLLHLEEVLRAAFPLLQAAHLELEAVDDKALPDSVRPLLNQIKNLVNATESSFIQTLDLLPALQTFLGIDQTKRYLVVFQNTNELRATGGFIGSFALLDIDRGEIRDLEIPGGGSYDLACCLTEHVIAPEPLHLIEPHWQFHDANWFADFPTSAQKLIWFYENSGGPSVDGLIALNSNLVPKLLEIFGPVELPKYNRVFTAENFIEETQKIVELEYDREENKPKAVIGELAPILIGRILTADQSEFMALLSLLGDAVKNKDLQIYAQNPETQAAFSRAKLTGEIKNTNGDALMLTVTNIAGGKTDEVVETEIHDRVKIKEDGSAIHRVEITRTHNGIKGTLFTGQRNVAYLRLAVPKGSKLIEARGFEIPANELFDTPAPDYQPDLDLLALRARPRRDMRSGTEIYDQFGYTMFGNWAQVDPGQSTIINLIYQTPPLQGMVSKGAGIAGFFGISRHQAYTLLIQKQSGLNAKVEISITLPRLNKIIWQTNNNFTGQLDADKFIALLLEN